MTKPVTSVAVFFPLHCGIWILGSRPSNTASTYSLLYKKRAQCGFDSHIVSHNSEVLLA